MNILLISSQYPPMKSGDSDHAFFITEALRSMGSRVTVLTNQHPCLVESADILPRMRTWSWRELPRLLNVLIERRPKVVFLVFNGWMYNRHSMVTFLPLYVKLVVPQSRVVVQFEGTGGCFAQNRIEQKVLRFLGREGEHFGTILSLSDRLVVMNEPLLASLQAHSSRQLETKTTVIPMVSLLPEVPDPDGEVRLERRAQLGLGPTDLLLVFFGFIYEGKGFETLLEALRRVRTVNQNVYLAALGGANQEDTSPNGAGAGFNRLLSRESAFKQKAAAARSLAASMELEEAVFWIPRNDDPLECSRWLRACDVGVLPFDAGAGLSRSTVLGLAAHGLPLIATIGPETDHRLRNAGASLFFEPGDAGSLARTIEDFLTDQTLRERCAANALVLISQHASLIEARSRYHEVCHGLTTNGSPVTLTSARKP